MYRRLAAAIVRRGSRASLASAWERRSELVVSRRFQQLMTAVSRVRDDEAGQALVEYSLLLVLIAVAAVGVVATFGVDVSKLYQSIVDVYP
jgi:Flp pilus assembly pilin Flp